MATYELTDDEVSSILESENKVDRFSNMAAGARAASSYGFSPELGAKMADPGPVGELTKKYRQAIEFDIEPDKLAKDVKLAKNSGLPLEIIRGSGDARKDAMKRAEWNFGRSLPRHERMDMIEKNNPATNRFLSAAGNMNFITDSPESLAIVENMFTSVTKGWKESSMSKEIYDAAFRQILGDDSPETEKHIAAIEEKMRGEGYQPSNLWHEQLYGLGKQLRQRADQVNTGLLTSSAAVAAGGLLTAMTGVGAPVGGAMLATGGTGIAAALGSSTLAAGMGGAGFAAGSAYEGLKMEAGSAYRELKQIKGADGQGLDPAVMRGAAFLIGAANSGIEVMQLNAILKSLGLGGLIGKEVTKKIAADPAVKSIFKAMGKRGWEYLKLLGVESGQEGVQQGVNIVGRNAAKALSPGKFDFDSFGDAAGEIADTIGSSFVEFSLGMVPGPFMGAVSDINRNVKRREYNIRRAEGLSIIQDAMNKAAQESPLGQRAPEKMSEFLRGLSDTVKNPFASVYIPASSVNDVMNARGMDEEGRTRVVADLLGTTVEDFSASIASGSDIVLGSEQFAILNMQDAELGSALIGELKADPDGVSLKNVDAARSEHRLNLRDELRFTGAVALGSHTADELSKLAKDSGLDRVYVGADAVQTLFQDAAPEELAAGLETLGISEADYDQALESGEDLEISTERLIKGGIPNDMFKSLREDLRTEPSGMTLRDAKNYNERGAEAFGDTGAWVEKAERTLSNIESGMAVEADIKARLTLARYDDAVAGDSAKVYAGHIMRSAQRMGMSPQDYFKMYGDMRFVRGDGADDGRVFMQAAGYDDMLGKARLEMDATKKLYNGTKLFGMALNGVKSNLTDEQWVIVRTPAFKKWFGNWEAKAQWNNVQGIEPLAVAAGLVSDEEAKSIYEKIGNSKPNMYDGIRAVFVMNALQKVQGHKNAALINRCVPILNDLFEGAVPIYVERERNPKKSNNIVGFHNYLSKVTQDGDNYYVRFTVQELKPSQILKEKKGKTELHNIAVSDIQVYSEEDINKAGITPVSSGLDSGDNAYPHFVDKRLAEWLADVKGSVSQVVDENGEPLVVYHGTNNVFNIFDSTKGQRNDAGWLGEGYYFYSGFDDAALYSRGKNGNVMGVFLDVKNPYYATAEDMRRLAEANDPDVSEKFTKDLIAEGYDGVYFNGDLRGEWVAFDSRQIKSATDNRGTFDAGNADIYYQSAWHASPRDFDAFDLSYALSGEGAMAHGHGVYTAGVRWTSEGYRDRFSSRNFSITYDGNASKDYSGDIRTALELLESQEWYRFDLDEDSANPFTSLIQKLEKKKDLFSYESDILDAIIEKINENPKMSVFELRNEMSKLQEEMASKFKSLSSETESFIRFLNGYIFVKSNGKNLADDGWVSGSVLNTLKVERNIHEDVGTHDLAGLDIALGL